MFLEAFCFFNSYKVLLLENSFYTVMLTLASVSHTQFLPIPTHFISTDSLCKISSNHITALFKTLYLFPCQVQWNAKKSPVSFHNSLICTLCCSYTKPGDLLFSGMPITDGLTDQAELTSNHSSQYVPNYPVHSCDFNSTFLSSWT